jgi:hypothetical protein
MELRSVWQKFRLLEFGMDLVLVFSHAPYHRNGGVVADLL